MRKEEPRIYVLLMKLRDHGGCIVRADDCSGNETAEAIRDGRHTLDRDGFGYVWLPPK